MKNFQKSLGLLDKLIKKLQTNTAVLTKAPAPVVEQKTDNQPKKQNKEKKQKQKKQKKPKAEPTEEEKFLQLFEMADLRVGEITEAKPLEGSDKLYIEQISFGDETRQILSGLQPFVAQEDMKGKVIVFYNLKPRKLAGQESFGMVLCSENKEKDNVELLRPLPGAKLGERVTLDGQTLNLVEGKNINSKNMVKFLEELVTDVHGQASFGKYRLRTECGLLDKATIPNGIIR